MECARLLLVRGADIDVVDVSSWLVFCTNRVAWALRAVCGERWWMFLCELGCGYLLCFGECGGAG